MQHFSSFRTSTSSRIKFAFVNDPREKNIALQTDTSLKSAVKLTANKRGYLLITMYMCKNHVNSKTKWHRNS